MRVPSEELNYHLEILRRGRSLKWVTACYERAFHSGNTARGFRAARLMEALESKLNKMSRVISYSRNS